MRQETINIYTIEDHPNKEACLDWIRNNCHDLGDYVIQEMVDSLKALANAVKGDLDYRLGIVPDRGEHVSITEYSKSALVHLHDKKNEYPLTGVWCDYAVIEGLACGELEQEVLRVLHSEGEYLYSDEGLTEMCLANEYEFNEDGSIH